VRREDGDPTLTPFQKTDSRDGDGSHDHQGPIAKAAIGESTLPTQPRHLWKNLMEKENTRMNVVTNRVLPSQTLLVV